MLCLLALDDLESAQLLVKREGDYLVGIMNEIENHLSVYSQKSSYSGVFVVTTGILLHQSLVKQIVYENIAALIGHKGVPAEHLQVLYLRTDEESLRKT